MIQPPPKTAPVKLLPSGKVIEVAPGHLAAKVVPAPAEHIPTFGVSRWQAVGDGTYKPVIRLHEQYLDLPDAVQAFGIPRDKLRRLITAGFIAGRKPSPGRWQVNIVSLSEHLQAVEEDPDFWTPERIRKYAEAL